jgi:hypothetical protein
VEDEGVFPGSIIGLPLVERVGALVQDLWMYLRVWSITATRSASELCGKRFDRAARGGHGVRKSRLGQFQRLLP